MIEQAYARFGEVTYVTVRRKNDKNVKGTVLIEFKDKSSAEQVLAEKDSLKYKGEPLEVSFSGLVEHRMTGVSILIP
jgi:RNA recognition motif-containing protein